ncbi:helicase SKI2W [Nilaparvata lugens]|uniref:helicase SKI2W n=1 Tax=Nilaparvata lugens TaxID=108931 RepID=UPI00193C954A|nr:helicase SKI2W [Nilaparvata lugens]
MTVKSEVVSIEPPPVCPNVTQELAQYLCHPEKLSIYNYEKAHQFWDRDPKPSSLKNFSTCKLASTLKVERDLKTGKLLGFKETLINPSISEDIIPINFDIDLLSTPPGLSHGYNFDEASSKSHTPSKNIVNMMHNLQMEDSLALIGGIDSDTKQEQPANTVSKVDISTKEQDEIIPMEANVPVLKITEARSLTALKELQWAEELAVKPVPDFYERVPKMACTWDFELDPFQKLAIVKLEEESNVFVAAHTSAGKTVVAEYAIALSLQRCTRAIYTSPIKALSNQKYRDFKNNFEIKKKMGGVGLITGDIQMNPKAPCLIMTTEILRSMLYNRSEVVQDLEYVVFDEVHYINDPDRGHVWEEVMMLLPNHVKIIMLSATVPNAIEFANWVGKSKNKKVYLISTNKRPVPLHFYLYPGLQSRRRQGQAGKALLHPRGRRPVQLQRVRKLDFVWVGSSLWEGPTSPENTGYDAAKADDSKKSDQKQMMKQNQYQKRMNFQQLVSMWKTFIIHLKNEDKLPVVIFVLSRARCDTISDYLKSLDIVGDKDNAHYIHQFFKKSIEHLKDEDRNLPQRHMASRKITPRTIGLRYDAAKADDSKKSDQKQMMKQNQYQKRMNFQQLVSMWKTFIIHLKNEDKLPVVIFVLSRARCDTISDYLKSLDIVGDKDNAHYIHQFFKKSIEHLKDEDRNLPQVGSFHKTVVRSVCISCDKENRADDQIHAVSILAYLALTICSFFIHMAQYCFHSTYSILLLQILLATETFAMGVNMPTKTVVFETIRKFDGKESRDLNPAEFIQMAGRAGRRGIDQTGTVIILCKESVPALQNLKNMMLSKPSKLESQFKVTYATILKTLLRTGEASNAVDKLMSSSYKQHSEQYKQDDAKDEQLLVNSKIEELERDLVVTRDANLFRLEGAMRNFYDFAIEYLNQRKLCQEELVKAARWRNHCHAGRYVLLSTGKFTKRLGIILGIERSKATCKVLIFVNPDESTKQCGCQPKHCDCELWFQIVNILKYKERFVPDDNAVYTIVKIEMKEILEILDLTDMYDEREFDIIMDTVNFYHFKKPPQLPRSLISALQNLHTKSLSFQVNNIIKFANKIPAAGFKLANQKLDNLKMEFGKFNVNEFLKYERQFRVIFQLKTLQNKKMRLDKIVNEYSMTGLFEAKKQILKELKYLDNSDNVELKGKGAIRLPSNEIMVTELIFRNVLSEFQPPEIAALLSSLVFQAKTNIEIEDIKKQIPDSLKKGMEKLEKLQLELAKKEECYREEIEEDHREFVELNFGLIHVVYQWACDKLFCETIEMTDVQEGIVVRCIQQLNEVLNSVKDVAQKVGDNSLKSKMEEASNSIKRDIVFAASLYLQ